jgi:hypothetical protein
MTMLALLSDAGGNCEEQPAEAPAVVPFAAGRTVELDHSMQTVRLRSPNGQIELTVRVTADGPVLSFGTAALELVQTGTLRLDVGKLELRARMGVEIESLGSVTQRVIGDHTLHCQGEARVEANTSTMIAHGGDLELESSEDVRIAGERVLLNC